MKKNSKHAIDSITKKLGIILFLLVIIMLIIFTYQNSFITKTTSSNSSNNSYPQISSPNPTYPHFAVSTIVTPIIVKPNQEITIESTIVSDKQITADLLISIKGQNISKPLAKVVKGEVESVQHNFTLDTPYLYQLKWKVPENAKAGIYTISESIKSDDDFTDYYFNSNLATFILIP